MPKNAINWFEIQTTDLERATRFYSAIFDAPLSIVEAMGERVTFLSFDWNGGVGGSLVCRADARPTADGTLALLNAEGRLAEVVARIEPAGGRVLAPQVPIGENGFIAIFTDSEGNRIGLHSST